MSVITVRLPSMVHKQLKELAYRRRKSLNLICVDALVADLDAAQEFQSDTRKDATCQTETKDGQSPPT